MVGQNIYERGGGLVGRRAKFFFLHHNEFLWIRYYLFFSELWYLTPENYGNLQLEIMGIATDPRGASYQIKGELTTN